jgi:hypothetical protein
MVSREIRSEGRKGVSLDLVSTVAYFALFLAIASLVGAFFPSMIAGPRAHPNWNMFLIAIVNATVAGTCLGGLCALLFLVGFAIFRGQNQSRSSADRATDMLQAPLFILGVANGALVAILTGSRFGGTSIWGWWLYR